MKIIHAVLHFFKQLVVSTIQHNIGALAATISFFAFSGMIPVFYLLVYGTLLIVPHALVADFISKFLSAYIPALPDMKVYLTPSLSRLVDLGSKVRVISVLSFLWTAVGGFVSLQRILDRIWEIHKRRSFIKQYLVSFGMLAILLVLTVSSSLITSISPAWVHHLLGTHESRRWIFLLHGISRISFPVLLFVTLYCCYRFLPSHVLPEKFLFLGALTSTLGIYVSRWIFIWYTGHLGRYELIYGSMTFVMLFLFWIYVTSNIVLFGGEVAVTLNKVAGNRSR